MHAHSAGIARNRAHNESCVGGASSMLLDSVSPEEVLSIESMGRGVPRQSMDSVHHPMHSISDQSEAGKSDFDALVAALSALNTV
jgi:hypothetical protein